MKKPYRVATGMILANAILCAAGCSGSQDKHFIDREGKPVARYAPSWWKGFVEGLAEHADSPELERFCEQADPISMPPWFFESVVDVSAWDSDLIALQVGNGTRYFHKDGTPVIKLDCPLAGTFCEGLAPSCVGFEESIEEMVDNILWGYVDATGDFVIEPKYTRAQPFSEGLALVWEGGGGRPIQRTKSNERFSSEPNLERKAGYIDHEGRYVIPPEWMNGYPCSEGLCVAEGFDGQSAVFTTKGKRVDAFDDVVLRGPFHEGLALASTPSGGGFKYVDTKGNVALSLGEEYGAPGEFHEGRAIIMKDRGFGYIDKTGKEVIEAQYSYGTDFHDGVAVVTE